MENKKAKPWLFMGLGNVIFNEDPAYARIYLMMYKVIEQKDDSMTFEKLLNDRDELIKDGHVLPLKELIQTTLTDEEISQMRSELDAVLEDNWLKYNPLLPDAKEMLEAASKIYNIGAIANGPAFLRAVLQETEILKYFKAIVISEEFGTPKPGKRIFQEAISEAKNYCSEKNENFIESPMFMVGDSLENDITPAKALDMTTIQLLWDIPLKYEKSELSNEPTFHEYLAHLKDHSSKRRKPANEMETPSFIVSSLEELTELISSDRIYPGILR